jgi:hypothetical protein
MSFQREPLEPGMWEAKPLLEAHWEEVAHFKDIPLNPDYGIYQQLEAMGVLRIYSMRREDGSLSGYVVFLVKPNLHYQQSLQAFQDIVYVDPNERLNGAFFLMWCDEQLKAEGVQVVCHRVKHAVDFGPLLKRIGYESVETMWVRRLDK